MQLKHYLVVNDLYTETQSAHCANHSTETAFLRFSNDINLALHNHDNVFLVLLDSSSAFDTIVKGVLIKRLHPRFGLRISAQAWNESYLANRLQSTVIRDV